MWVYLGFMRQQMREEQFAEHPTGIREITRLRLTSTVPFRSVASRTVVENGIMSVQTGETSFIEIEFDNNRQRAHQDFRPLLPLIFHF